MFKEEVTFDLSFEGQIGPDRVEMGLVLAIPG